MREIKFRGKRVNGGEWVKSMTISHGTIKRKMSKVFFEINPGKWVGIIPNTIGQFTGLKDKNGKDIYEGDILNNGIRNYIVCWNNERGAWWLKNKDLIYTTPLGFLSTELFVIGSVHDNPELLKGGNDDHT